MWDGPIVAEVRRIREDLAARLDFDVGAIFAEARERQALLGPRLVRRRTRPRREQGTATDLDSSALNPGR